MFFFFFFKGFKETLKKKNRLVSMKLGHFDHGLKGVLKGFLSVLSWFMVLIVFFFFSVVLVDSGF